MEETPLEVVREIFETNYFGNVSVLRAVTPIMRKQRSGRIVNVGSLAGRVVDGLPRPLLRLQVGDGGPERGTGLEMAEFNVKVAIIEPGCVVTPIWGKGGELPTEPSPYPKSLQRLMTLL